MPEKAVTTPLQIVALRAESYEPENGAVVISLRARYSTAERKYLVPIECLHDLVLDLQRLNAAATVGVNAAPELVQPPPNSEATSMRKGACWEHQHAILLSE